MPTPDAAEAVTITFGGQTTAPTPVSGDILATTQSTDGLQVQKLSNGNIVMLLNSGHVWVGSPEGVQVALFYSGHPSNAGVEALDGGGFIIAEGSQGRRYDNAGVQVSNYSAVGVAPEFAELPDGGWIAVSDTGIFRHAADGAILASYSRNSTGVSREAIILADGTYVVAYSGGGGFWLHFSADDQVLDTGTTAIAGQGSQMSVAALAGGGWVAAGGVFRADLDQLRRRQHRRDGAPVRGGRNPGRGGICGAGDEHRGPEQLQP